MKILVLSDSHGNLSNMVDVVERTQPDHVFHLGDHADDAEELGLAYPDLPIDYVAGNCDWSSKTPSKVILTVDGVRMLLCHGHHFGVKSGLSALTREAIKQNARVALFGHTHKAHCSQCMGVSLYNPGSCGIGCEPTYAILTIQNGAANFQIYSVYEEE